MSKFARFWPAKVFPPYAMVGGPYYVGFKVSRVIFVRNQGPIRKILVQVFKSK